MQILLIYVHKQYLFGTNAKAIVLLTIVNTKTLSSVLDGII